MISVASAGCFSNRYSGRLSLSGDVSTADSITAGIIVIMNCLCCVMELHLLCYVGWFVEEDFGRLDD